ncbi:hypothetical protein ABNG14_35445 [Streptomyces rapamycinicus]
MLGQQLGEGVARLVVALQDRRVDRAVQRTLVQLRHVRGELGGGGRERRGVEGEGGVDLDGAHVQLPGDRHDPVQDPGGAADHGLLVVVLGGDGQQRLVHQLQQLAGALGARGQGHHAAVDAALPLDHGHAPGDDPDPVLDREGPGRHQGGDLTEAVPGQHVGGDALGGEDLVGGQTGAVDGDLGGPRVVVEQIAQIGLALAEEHLGDAAAVELLGHGVEPLEDPADLGMALLGAAERLAVEAALSGEEERRRDAGGRIAGHADASMAVVVTVGEVRHPRGWRGAVDGRRPFVRCGRAGWARPRVSPATGCPADLSPPRPFPQHRYAAPPRGGLRPWAPAGLRSAPPAGTSQR